MQEVWQRKHHEHERYMNPDTDRLRPYPFERLAKLKEGVTPPKGLPHIALSIGEPKHSPPDFILRALCESISGLGSYPTSKGMPELRSAIAGWLTRRYSLKTGRVDLERHVLPVCGTREGLFSFAQAMLDRTRTRPLVLMSNPFYQIYEGAAFLAGAEPWLMNADEQNGFLPDMDSVPDEAWKRCQLLYLCTPGNPTGAVMDLAYFKRVLEIADRYGFIVASDECYTEIYFDESQPPLGLLEACEKLGRHDFKRCVAFHSLSKRSSLPGMRSGFVAGDAKVLDIFLKYRTYHGCTLPVPVQQASALAWSDDRHVIENRVLYRQKFQSALEILSPVMDVKLPAGAFYLWPRTPIDDERFARELYAEQNVTVLPGSYLSRSTARGDPGKSRLRISLVAAVDECTEAALRIRSYVETL
jgi:N-succinyldiaminopimelate aminotransferase